MTNIEPGRETARPGMAKGKSIIPSTEKGTRQKARDNEETEALVEVTRKLVHPGWTEVPCERDWRKSR